MSDLDERLRRVRFIACDVDGVLTDGRIWFDGDGRPFRAFHVRDGTAFSLWHLSGGKSALVSGLSSKAVEAVALQWRCADCHTGVQDKVSVCRDLAQRHGITLDEMAFIGDDVIDRNAMRMVGLAVAVADAVPRIRCVAHWVTTAPGGGGAVREVVARILEAKGLLDKTIDEYCARKNLPSV